MSGELGAYVFQFLFPATEAIVVSGYTMSRTWSFWRIVDEANDTRAKRVGRSFITKVGRLKSRMDSSENCKNAKGEDGLLSRDKAKRHLYPYSTSSPTISWMLS
jgi:hypothetical protein